MKDPSELGPLQLNVLDALWEGGEGTVGDVQARLGADDHAYTTVATVLSRLEKAGYLTRRSEGRQYVYGPLVKRGEVRTSLLKGMVGRIFGGSPVALVQHLLREEDVSSADLAHIKALIAQQEEGER